MSTWKVILATLVIFGAGVVTGGLSFQLSHRTRVPAPPSPRPPGQTPLRFNSPEFLQKLDLKLELTPEQHQRIEQILRESKERTKPLWREITPRLNEEVKCVRKEIKAVLTPEQLKLFEAIMPARKPEDPSKKNGRLREGVVPDPQGPFSPKQPPGEAWFELVPALPLTSC